MASCTINLYLESAADLKQEYERICAILTALYDQQLNQAINQGTEEYRYNDGQHQIVEKFRSMESFDKAIFLLERRKQTVFNKLNGRTTTLKPLGSYRRGRY